MPDDGHSFDLATAVAGGPEHWTAQVDPGWTVAGRPNGGYLLALATRAALEAAGQPHPLAVSAHFLAPSDLGPAELEVRRLRAGRNLSTARVTLVQEGAARLEALVTAGRIDPDADPGWRRSAGPDGLAPVEDCVPGRPELPGGMRANLLEHIDLRLDPATLGWVGGRPGGTMDMRGWVRFADGRAADPLSLLQVVDALPPTSFDLGLASWAPTVELTVYLRGLPTPGWLACVVRGQLWQGGWFDEEAEVWDSAGRLVAQSRQLAGARPAAARPAVAMTDLARLDGPGTAAVADRLVEVYRAAMGAAPFHETEVEAGFFADELAGELEEPGFRCWLASDGDQVVGFAYGYETPEVPPEGWSGLVREAVGPDAAERWLEGQFAVVWIAVRPDRRGRGLGRDLLERLLAGAGTERAWLITHDLDTPARGLYRSLGFQELGRGPLGWHDAQRVVLGAELPPTGPPGR